VRGQRIPHNSWPYWGRSSVPTRGCQKTLTTYRADRVIILDDLLNDVCSKDVCKKLTKHSHHRNVSVILITQNLFHQDRYCSDISLNTKYLILLKNSSDKNQSLSGSSSISWRPWESVQIVYRRNSETSWLSTVRRITRYRLPNPVSNQYIPERNSYNLRTDRRWNAWSLIIHSSSAQNSANETS